MTARCIRRACSGVDALHKRTDKLSLKDINQAKQAVIEFLTASRSVAGLQWIE